MLEQTEANGWVWLPLDLPEVMSGPVPQGRSLAAWKKQLKNSTMPRPSAIDCIDLVLGVQRALKEHYRRYGCSPRIRLDDLYYDVPSGKATIYGLHIEGDARRDVTALTDALTDFFDFPRGNVVIDEVVRDELFARIKEMMAAVDQPDAMDGIEDKLRRFRQGWMNTLCGRPLGTVACLHIREFLDAPEPTQTALITALCAFHQVALISRVAEEKENPDSDCALVFSALNDAGLHVRPEPIVCRDDDITEAVEEYKHRSGGYKKRLIYITVSTNDRNAPRLPCLIVNADLPLEEHTVDVYRRKLRLISGKRAPVIERDKFLSVQTRLETEKNRLKNKYVFFHPVAEQRIHLIKQLIDDMQAKDPSPAATVWLDDALDKLAGEMRPVHLPHFFWKSDGEKHIRAIRETLWDDSTYLWSSAHFGFHT